MGAGHLGAVGRHGLPSARRGPALLFDDNPCYQARAGRAPSGCRPSMGADSVLRHGACRARRDNASGQVPCDGRGEGRHPTNPRPADGPTSSTAGGFKLEGRQRTTRARNLSPLPGAGQFTGRTTKERPPFRCLAAGIPTVRAACDALPRGFYSPLALRGRGRRDSGATARDPFLTGRVLRGCPPPRNLPPHLGSNRAPRGQG